MISATRRIAKPLLGIALFAVATGGGAVLWNKLKPTSFDLPSDSGAGPLAARETGPTNEASATLEGDRLQASHEHRDQRLTELNNQMADLKNELAQFKHTQNQKLTQLQASVQPPAAEAEPLSPEELERQEEQASAEIQAQENLLDQTMVTEEADPEWSQVAETSWIEVFQKEDLKEELKEIQLDNIECRTTLCRVELTPTDPAQGAVAFERGLRKLLHFTPWQGGAGFAKIENPDGQAPVAVFYLAREGHALP